LIFSFFPTGLAKPGLGEREFQQRFISIYESPCKLLIKSAMKFGNKKPASA
jgi:hypothetical protein